MNSTTGNSQPTNKYWCKNENAKPGYNVNMYNTRILGIKLLIFNSSSIIPLDCV